MTICGDYNLVAIIAGSVILGALLLSTGLVMGRQFFRS